jgi:hypothetical protein
MLALAHHYDEPVASGGVTYRSRVYGSVEADGGWGGYIVFFPVHGGRVIATDRETTQKSLPDLTYWASGLTHTYLHGALERALALQPEEHFARELERLERLEETAELRAETLELAATAARAESRLVEAERERTEENLLASVADAAEAEAEVHETVAAVAREQAQAADRALRKRKTGATPAGSRKKK